MEANNIRPFLIGICGGPLSGKSLLSKEISSSIGSEYEVHIISLVNYYKNLTEKEFQNKENYNFDHPNAIDFDLLYTNIDDLLNKKPTKLPKYDINTYIRKDKQEIIKNCEVIILEGIFAFYDERIRNLIDLKIFIDIDRDIQLSKIILKDIFECNRELRKIIRKYHKFVKPSYKEYILPTRKYADIILQKVDKDTSAIEIVSEYLKMQLNKMRKNEQNDLFSFAYEIIDPKYQYYDGKILVENVPKFISFIKEVFQDFIINKLDEQLISHIREKMINMLCSLLIRDLKKRKSDYSLDVNLLLFEKDSKKYDFKNYKNIFYFKISILSDNDIEVPINILKENKDCNIFIFTIFLAPKYAELLLNKEINTIIFTTIYFSDFFIKFDDIIKNNEELFHKKEFENIFLERIRNDFDYQNEEDLYDGLKFQ
jgi:uridine kinase